MAHVTRITECTNHVGWYGKSLDARASMYVLVYTPEFCYRRYIFCYGNCGWKQRFRRDAVRANSVSLDRWKNTPSLSRVKLSYAPMNTVIDGSNYSELLILRTHFLRGHMFNNLHYVLWLQITRMKNIKKFANRRQNVCMKLESRRKWKY